MGSEYFPWGEGSEVTVLKNEGSESFTQEAEGSENLGHFFGKHSGRLLPIKNDRPLK